MASACSKASNGWNFCRGVCCSGHWQIHGTLHTAFCTVNRTLELRNHLNMLMCRECAQWWGTLGSTRGNSGTGREVRLVERKRPGEIGDRSPISPSFVVCFARPGSSYPCELNRTQEREFVESVTDSRFRILPDIRCMSLGHISR
jgi:hypothetical protein